MGYNEVKTEKEKKQMEKETKVKIVKIAVTLTASVCAATVATAAIKGMLPTGEVTRLNKVIYAVGTFVLASALAQYGAEYMGDLVDGFLTGDFSKSPQAAVKVIYED